MTTSTNPFYLFKPSHRTRPEQWVGLGIYLLIGFTVQACNQWILQGGPTIIWTLYSLLLSLSMWSLWRRCSLRISKLEASLFLSQLLFQTTSVISFVYLRQAPLPLVLLLLLWFNHLTLALLYWKKERLAGLLMVPPFFLILGTLILTMR